MKLTDAKVKNTKPGDRPQRFSDGGGMFLEVTPKGAKYWRLAYRFHGKQKLLVTCRDSSDHRSLENDLGFRGSAA